MKVQTGIENKVHTILDKNNISHTYSDLFGKEGMTFLHSLCLPENYKIALEGYLSVLEAVRQEIQVASRRVQQLAQEDPDAMLLMTVPGVGYYSALLIKSEIGMENILAGLVVEQDDGLVTVDVGGNVIQTMSDDAVGDRVSVLVRPEDVTLGLTKETTSARNVLSGSISRIASMGPLVRIEMECGFPLICLVTRRSAEELELTVGKQVYASFKATATHVITS